MKFNRPCLFLIFIMCLFVSFTWSQEKTLLGFNDKQSEQQLNLEKKFDSFLQAENLRTWMQRLAARPQHIG